MDLNSPLFDKIRAGSRADEPQAEQAVRGCDHPGCSAQGAFRAPMGRGREGRFFMFCLVHVKAYNAGYNYFNGMTDDAVAAYQKADLYGQRPTWKMGVNAASASRTGGEPGPPDPRDAVADPLGLFADRLHRARKPEPEAVPRMSAASAKALDTLGLEQGVDRAAIKARYKELVKRLHPDANGGDRSREDQLRAIINAYNHLRQAKVA